MPVVRTFAALLCVVAGTACGSTDAASHSDSSALARTPEGAPYAYERVPLDTTRLPGAVVDSIFPMPEMIRRFRLNLPDPRGLVGGADSRQSLAMRFVAALATADRATLGQLTLSRAEFAYLYYPNSRDAGMTNGMPPTLRWDLMTLSSEKGIGRAIDRIGGKPLTLQSLDCPNPPTTSGTIAMHDDCTVRIGRADGTTFTGRLFGSIIEHAGRFKFAGYNNDM